MGMSDDLEAAIASDSTGAGERHLWQTPAIPTSAAGAWLDYFAGMWIGDVAAVAAQSATVALQSPSFGGCPRTVEVVCIFTAQDSGCCVSRCLRAELGGCVHTKELPGVAAACAVGCACSRPWQEATSLRSRPFPASCTACMYIPTPWAPSAAAPSCPASSCADRQACFSMAPAGFGSCASFSSATLDLACRDSPKSSRR